MQDISECESDSESECGSRDIEVEMFPLIITEIHVDSSISRILT